MYRLELLHLYTPSRQLRSSADTRVLEYHSFEQSRVVSALSLIRLQLSGTNPLFLSVSSFKSSLKTFLFLKAFSSVPLP